MKYLKYAGVLLAVALVILIALYMRRDSIARDIANSVLGDSGVIVTDLSVDFLGTDHVQFSRIVLRLESGTVIDIRGLSFPLSFPSMRPELVAIDRMSVDMPADDAAPDPYAPALHAVLDLPRTVPSTVVTLKELDVSGFAPITGLVWASGRAYQRLSLTMLAANVSIEIDSAEERSHKAFLSAAAADLSDALTIALDIEDRGDGFAIDGTVAAVASPWLPMMRDAGLLPASIESLDATLQGRLDIRLDDGEAGRVTARLAVSSAAPMRMTYRAGAGEALGVGIDPTDPVEIEVDYPSLDWTARHERSALRIDVAGIGEVPATMRRLECRTGVRCTFDAALETGPLVLDDTQIGSARMSLSATLELLESTRVEVAPALDLRLNDVRTPAISVASIAATGFSGGQLSDESGAWRARAANLGLRLTGITNGEGLVASLPIALSRLSVEASDGGSIDGRFGIEPATGALTWRAMNIVTPGVAGEFSLRGSQLDAEFRVTGRGGSLTADAFIRHDLTSGAGGAGLLGASLTFDREKLSARFKPLPFEADLIAGTAGADVDLTWTRADDDRRLVAGSFRIETDGIAGFYNDIGFAGVDAAINGELLASAIRLGGSTLNVGLLDVGLPLEQIETTFHSDVNRSLNVDRLTMSAIGGRVAADPFVFDPDAVANSIVFRPESVQLRFMAELAGFESIEASGSLSGVLPVTVSGGSATVTGGRLENDPPGGFIRYRGAAPVDAAAPASALGTASRALSNLQFDSLTSDVNYTDGGDLILQMRLKGVNPDMDASQPIVLNLRIENNIPQLFKSLQAIRSIEDVLERRTKMR